MGGRCGIACALGSVHPLAHYRTIRGYVRGGAFKSQQRQREKEVVAEFIAQREGGLPALSLQHQLLATVRRDLVGTAVSLPL